jgi:hypothetical protein
MRNWLPVLFLLAGLGSSISVAQNGIVDCFGQPTLHAARVKGQVFDLMGETIQGATVSLEIEGRTIQQAVTDASGRFGFKSVGGSIQLHVNARGFAPGYAYINVGPDLRTLIHPGIIYVILGVGNGEPCPSATTSRREFLRMVQENSERNKGSRQKQAAQK